jgi:hypothetical protein
VTLKLVTLLVEALLANDDGLRERHARTYANATLMSPTPKRVRPPPLTIRFPRDYIGQREDTVGDGLRFDVLGAVSECPKMGH